MRRSRTFLTVAVVNLILVGALLSVIEGLSSFTVLAYRAIISPPLAERRYTEPDSLLGWISRPNVSIADMYGKDRHLVINSQRLRSKTDFTTAVPAGKTRIVCSGDSFTLGNGVANEHAWCQRLAALDARLETVNMGQGGYGIDQMYLWYRRDGAKLPHQIHLFAFVTEDIVRMQLDNFLGYPKPVLGLQDGKLVVRNAPVPPPTFLGTMFNKNLGRLSGLSSVRIIQKLASSRERADKPVTDEQLRPLLSSILSDLGKDRTAQVRVLVYLPMLTDYTGKRSNRWRSFFKAEARKNALLYVDLIAAFRKLPPQAIEGLYIGAKDTDYIDTPGHFNELGNLTIARLLLAELHRLPRVRQVIDGRSR